MAHTTAYRTLKAIFDNFIQMEEKKTDGGQTEKVNALEFVQRSAMEQVIWSFDNMATYQRNEVLGKAKRELEQLVRSYTDTEIPQRQLAAKVAWCRRIESQVVEIEGFGQALRDAYHEILGTPYQPRAKAKTQAASSATVAEALAILGKTVEVSESYNSDSGKAQYN